MRTLAGIIWPSGKPFSRNENLSQRAAFVGNLMAVSPVNFLRKL
jgi:hypothetical protein